MDDKRNPERNQSRLEGDQLPRPIFETMPIENELNLKPEEISPDFEILPTRHNSMDNRKKFFIIGGSLLFFLLIFILIIKVFLGGNAAVKEIKLSYWGLWEDKPILNSLIKDYENKNKNVKIDYRLMSLQDYRDKLLVRSKNGQGPDIFRFHNTWLPEIKDVVSQLPSSIMSSKEFDKTFYPIQKKDLQVGDFYFGIPLTIDGLVLIYNNSLFKKVGISTRPTTWEELINYAAKLSVKDTNGKIITSGIALGTATNVEHFSDIFGLFLIQNGGDINNLDKPEAIQALSAYRKFAEPPNNVWDDSMPNSITAFIQEKVAMIIVPSWEVLAIKSTNPSIDLKVVTIPILPGVGNKPVSIASYWVEGVSRYSKNQIEAWKFIKFLSEKENMTKLYETESKTRLFGEPYSRRDLASILSANEYIGAVIDQAESYQSLPMISRTLDNGLNDQIIQYIQNAINSTVQGVSPEEALKTAKQGIDQVLSNFTLR